MCSPLACALCNLDCHYIILVHTLRHLIPAKCDINSTWDNTWLTSCNYISNVISTKKGCCHIGFVYS